MGRPIVNEILDMTLKQFIGSYTGAKKHAPDLPSMSVVFQVNGVKYVVKVEELKDENNG